MGKKNIEKKNILIIGCINSGKSALANVTCSTEHFEENERTVRNSKDFQEYDFVYDNIEYHVVDIRVKLIEKEILYKIGKVIYSMPGGINQVLFVIDQRLTAEEIEKLKEIENEILEIKIYKYITIVRTKFGDFKSKDKCKIDEEDLRSLNKKIFYTKLLNKPRMHIVHVDNSPIHICSGDNDNDDNDEIQNNRKRREKSRAILIEHLKKVCSKKYKLSMWDKLDKSKKLEKDGLVKLVKEYLKSDDPTVAKIINKLKTDNN